jgi:hypothetical protein
LCFDYDGYTGIYFVETEQTCILKVGMFCCMKTIISRKFIQ